MSEITNMIDEKLKTSVFDFLAKETLPTLKETIDKFVEKLKQKAEISSGWVKFRDGSLLPFAINTSYAIIKLLVENVIINFTRSADIKL